MAVGGRPNTPLGTLGLAWVQSCQGRARAYQALRHEGWEGDV